jgi:transposase
VKHDGERVGALEEELRQAVAGWSLEPVLTDLMALRGVDLITGVGILAELGDLRRFEDAGELMAYVGLIGSEYSSGPKRRRGGITKTGNGHVRRLLIEAAWTYRFPARKTAYLQRRATKASEEAQAIAWKAQKRLHRRLVHLIMNRNKRPVVAVTAVARELTGFIWAIACQAMPRAHTASCGRRC